MSHQDTYCGCWQLVRCEDCHADVRVTKDGALIARHADAGHRMTPYGCEDCQPALKEGLI